MVKTSDKFKQPVIGRVKAAVVSDDGNGQIGIISEIIIRSSSNEKADRFLFQGPGCLKESNKKHLESVVLPIVDRITDNLGVSQKNYEISVLNLGATASAGVGVEISGFSADLPMLIAFLSAALQIGIRQEVLCTGHVASIDGDLAPVRHIPAKLDAAVSTPEITTFVVPDLEKDRSLKLLTPVEYQAAEKSLYQHKGDIKIHRVSDIYEATRLCFTEEAILSGSLAIGFYENEVAVDFDNPINRLISLLVDANERRFWDLLEQSFLNCDIQRIHFLLKNFTLFYVLRECYPKSFGKQLSNLLISLPPSVRKLRNLFPLIQMDYILKLSQFGQKKDHEDIRALFKTVFNEQNKGFSNRFENAEEVQTSDGEMGNQLLERIFTEIREENISKKVGHSFDLARSRYIMDYVTIDDGFEFNKAIVAFYAHLFRHTVRPAGEITEDALSADAIELVSEAFKSKGGYEAALAEGRYGPNGGLRFVFDVMTEFLKQRERKKYINMVFKEAIDSTDWGLKIKLAEILKKRIWLDLPVELRELPAEQLARNLEEIVACYSESIDKVSTLLKRL